MLEWSYLKVSSNIYVYQEFGKRYRKECWIRLAVDMKQRIVFYTWTWSEIVCGASHRPCDDVMKVNNTPSMKGHWLNNSWSISSDPQYSLYSLLEGGSHSAPLSLTKCLLPLPPHLYRLVCSQNWPALSLKNGGDMTHLQYISSLTPTTNAQCITPYHHRSQKGLHFG